MNNNTQHITVFEHQVLKVDDKSFKKSHLKRLEIFYGENGVPYFKLIHNGIKFTEFVGVLQVGNLIIEVLPKADKDSQKTKWRNILIGMLRAVGIFNIHAPSNSSLQLKTNSILDLYFELFLKEVEYLLNKGLVKKYREVKGNSLALKGNIIFGKHIQQNLVHQERFFIEYTTYDKKHFLHQIIYKTLRVLRQINTNIALSSRIGRLLLNFPEMKDLKVSEDLFNRIIFNRKTNDYKNAINISKLILLNYHPDISKGQNHVLALMFDMNILWEKFIYASLRKYKKANQTITAQSSKRFWKPKTGNWTKIRPDIVIDKEKENTIILDTKWKNITEKNPSAEDLRQMYVYHEYFEAGRVALVYPGTKNIISGTFNTINTEVQKKCSVISVSTNENIYKWQEEIAQQIFEEMEDNF